ncbi:MAG: hypothetical protein C4567_15355 [Deltaproteobacteria bacterium]|nr:MAG: hypothetical protein C4567_15355 [Deltaproteobacteria bacterium]
MKKLSAVIVNLFLLTMPWTLAWAGADGGEKAESLQKKVNLTSLGGINYCFAAWYNDNIWLYAIIVTVLMALLGGIIALVTDVILKNIGMEVNKIEHHE